MRREYLNGLVNITAAPIKLSDTLIGMLPGIKISMRLTEPIMLIRKQMLVKKITKIDVKLFMMTGIKLSTKNDNYE